LNFGLAIKIYRYDIQINNIIRIKKPSHLWGF
jgi:hypothetical protein